MANQLQFIHFHRIGQRFSSDIKKYFGFLSIDSWLKQIQFRKYPALLFYKIQIWFWFFITTGIKLPPCHLGKRFQAFLEMKLSIKNWNNFKDPSTITKLIIGRIALLPLNYTRDRIILSQNFDWCLIKKGISYFGVHAPSPEIQYQEVILLPGMTFWNHKLPLRAANKAITNGPDATIKARTVSCAITSKFILVQPLCFRFSLIKSTIE